MVATAAAALLLLSSVTSAGLPSAGGDAPLGALCSWSADGAPAALSLFHPAVAEVTLADGTRQRNVSFTHDGTETTVEQRVFVTPPATETLLRFKHGVGVHPRSAVLSEINTLDVTLPVPVGAVATLHGFAGSAESATDYSATEQRLLAGAHTAGGRLRGLAPSRAARTRAELPHNSFSAKPAKVAETVIIMQWTIR